jgi:hypothetical protein
MNRKIGQLKYEEHIRPTDDSLVALIHSTRYSLFHFQQRQPIQEKIIEHGYVL